MAAEQSGELVVPSLAIQHAVPKASFQCPWSSHISRVDHPLSLAITAQAFVSGIYHDSGILSEGIDSRTEQRIIFCRCLRGPPALLSL